MTLPTRSRGKGSSPHSNAPPPRPAQCLCLGSCYFYNLFWFRRPEPLTEPGHPRLPLHIDLERELPYHHHRFFTRQRPQGSFGPEEGVSTPVNQPLPLHSCARIFLRGLRISALGSGLSPAVIPGVLPAPTPPFPDRVTGQLCSPEGRLALPTSPRASLSPPRPETHRGRPPSNPRFTRRRALWRQPLRLRNFAPLS